MLSLLSFLEAAPPVLTDVPRLYHAGRGVLPSPAPAELGVKG